MGIFASDNRICRIKGYKLNIYRKIASLFGLTMLSIKCMIFGRTSTISRVVFCRQAKGLGLHRCLVVRSIARNKSLLPTSSLPIPKCHGSGQRRRRPQRGEKVDGIGTGNEKYFDLAFYKNGLPKYRISQENIAPGIEPCRWWPQECTRHP